MPLSDTALVILSAAAKRDDRLAELPAKLPAAARNAVARSLIKQSLLEETQPVPATLAWSTDEDGSAVGLRLTDAGLRALNIDPPGSEPEADTSATDAPTAPDAAAVQAEANAMPDALQAAQCAPVAASRASLRDAAAAVLDTWNDRDNNQRGLPEAIERLRTALATKPSRLALTTGSPRKSREGTKQQAVLALLRRPEGANIAQIVAATAWAQHTVRGFLANLKRKGITVGVLERVRQVGSGGAGAKGSYSTYRIAEAG